MVEHRGLCNVATNQMELFAVQSNSRVLQFASFTFDASISEIAMALCSGACLYLARREAIQPGKPLLDTLQHYQITHATLAASTLLACTLEERPHRPMKVVSCGEALPPSLAAHWKNQHDLFNAYGPTETTVCATTYHCQCPHTGSIPIGRPIANTRVYILDARGEPVPVGVTGKIYIGGAGLARGYWKQPQLTAERFVKDPFSSKAGARMYRTGDLGRWLPDGNIEFLGRNDFQVKVRGFRIELGEIETRLMQHAAVRQAVVIAREETPGDKRLVAYYVAEERGNAGAAHLQSGPTAEELRSHLLVQLPEYMVPAAYVRLTAFPLTPNGKLDRKALPMPEGEAYAVRGYEAPQGEVETILAEIWAQLLKVERVGRHDNFFELGGHSLLALSLVHRLSQRFELEIALRDVFAAPTLASLAQKLISAQLAEFDPNELAELASDIT